jgi:small subunit ribosomal protein S2
MSDLLIQQEKYLEAGIYIGTKIKTADMNPFIYKARKDKLYVLDLKKVDERLRYAAKFLSRYEASDIVVVASRTYAINSASKFAQILGCKVLAGRFTPGIFTNPARDNFTEPKLLFVCDPKGERQAVREAAASGVPVIALCDADNSTKFIDWIVPCNNKGRRSLALIFYLLAREVQKIKGIVKDDSELAYKPEDFEASVEEPEEQEG